MNRQSERSNPRRKPRFPRIQYLMKRRHAEDFDFGFDDDCISTRAG